MRTLSPGAAAIAAFIALFAVLHLAFSMPQAGFPVGLATLAGGIAYLLMATAIVLAARPAFLEDAFGGLDRMYRVHKTCGVLAGLLALVHFFLEPKGVPPELAGQIEATPSALFGLIALVALVLLLAITLNRKIAYHRWRMPHKLIGFVFIVLTAHFMSAPSVYFERFGPSGIILMLAAAIGIVAYLYSFLGFNQGRGTRFVIEAVNHLERATEVVLKPVGERLKFKPGQFAFVEILADGMNERHPFTISSSPGDERLRFTMKVLGDWTRRVRDELQPGGEVVVRGPYGRFDPSACGPDQVWIAGGVGITPFLSSLRAMEPGDTRQILLVYAVRETAEALYLDEISQRAERLGNVEVILLQSNEGEFASIADLKTRLTKPIAAHDFFLCGPQPMVGGLRKELKSEGVSPRQIHTEAFEFR